MITLNQLFEAMNQLVERLQSDEVSRVLADNCVILACLFGSQARADTWAQSDIDIAVLFSDAVSKEKRFELALTRNHQLAIELQRDDIQIVDSQQPPLLRHPVYYDGLLLHCPNDSVRIKFETTAFRDYVNTATAAAS